MEKVTNYQSFAGILSRLCCTWDEWEDFGIDFLAMVCYNGGMTGILMVSD